MDSKAIATVTLESFKANIDKELTVRWLVEIQGTTKTGEVFVKVHASAFGIEIHELLWFCGIVHLNCIE